MSTFIRSRGAVTVRLTAPAIPPAKNIRNDNVCFDQIKDDREVGAFLQITSPIQRITLSLFVLHLPLQSNSF